MIGTTTSLFVKARNVFRESPRAVNLQTSSATGLAPTAYMPPVGVPTPVAIGPKPSDVETIGISYRFQMQELRIGQHATGDKPVPGSSASLVGGR